MKRLITGGLTAALLTGCGALGLQPEPAPVKTAPTVVETVEVVRPVVHPPSEHEAAPRTEVGELIHRMDAAGCDFAGLTVTRGTVRKHSGTITITCNGVSNANTQAQ
jgi:hypothetical protein